MSSSDTNPEWKVVAIGRGSLATVSILTGRPVAFKHVLVLQRAPELKAEFEALCSLYHSCNTNAFFSIPRPLAYYDPDVEPTFVFPMGTPPGSSTRTRRPSDAPVPSLCRLYFGKIIATGGRPNKFFNSANFPLDVARYTQVLSSVTSTTLPSVEEIATGMGEMLGRLHWLAGYDGRDIEFVMGGASFSRSTQLITTSKLRSWLRKKEDIKQLVDAFFINDPYYPRPRAIDPIYQHFRTGYINAYPQQSKEAVDVAEAFLLALEAEQAQRDARDISI
ncbi:hypothetical protein BU17DRAFT_53305 [Hysterangium stoloniferum]|nr:hypothetical protein BU17DRAFT_53305 [Hysterangium stoloniferum]